MNTALIYPQLEFSEAQIPSPPYSILFIADYLKKKKIDVKIFDLRYDNNSEVINELSEMEPEYVGISVMTGPQIYYALKISNLIKKNFKNIKIVWGGIHSTILPSQTLNNHLIDVVVRGEGEKVYFDLISGKKLESIEGLSFRKNDKIIHNQGKNLLSELEINQLSIPWDLINPYYYIRNGNFNMITSRGCPFECAFCYNSIVKNKWRGWTTEKCINELNKVLNFNVNKINFYDDNFFAHPKRVEGLFKYSKKNNIIWKAELRVDRLNRNLAEKAKKHGCKQLFFGAESGSNRILKLIMKNINIEDIIKSAEITKDVGIIADYSWMIGIPGEEREDINKTIALIKKVKKINPESEFSIKILYPYPKTKIYEEAKNLGFQHPNNLLDWAKVRREKAPNYLKHKNQLETIALVSAIVGRKIFDQSNIPILKILKFYADFRWSHEVFSAGIENIIFKSIRNLISQFMSKSSTKGYDPFSQKIVKM